METKWLILSAVIAQINCAGSLSNFDRSGGYFSSRCKEDSNCASSCTNADLHPESQDNVDRCLEALKENLSQSPCHSYKECINVCSKAETNKSAKNIQACNEALADADKRFLNWQNRYNANLANAAGASSASVKQEANVSITALTELPVKSKDLLDEETIYERAKLSIVVIETRTGSGTGFVVSNNGVIVTNAHVLADTGWATVRFFDGKSFSVEKVVAFDLQHDLVAIHVQTNTTSLKLDRSDKISPGQKIVAIGNPGLFNETLDYTITDGIISGIRPFQGETEDCNGDVLQITAQILPGNSGGPILNMYGEVVGVSAFRMLSSTRRDYFNFAIPVKYVQKMLTNTQLDMSVPLFGVVSNNRCL